MPEQVFSVAGAEFIEPVARKKLLVFACDRDTVLDGEETDPKDSFGQTLMDTVNMYAAVPDQAGPRFYELLKLLPHLRPGPEADSILAWFILMDTRRALRRMVRDDKVAAAMFEETPEEPDIDLSAAEEDQSPTLKERDREITRSAQAEQQASDREIGDIAFGGNKDKIDETVRIDAAVGGHEFRSFTQELAPAVQERCKQKPLCVREISLIRTDPVTCFRFSSKWLIANLMGLGIGRDIEIPSDVFPRLEPVIGHGIERRDVHQIIQNLSRLVRSLRPPEYRGMDETKG